MYSDKTYSFIYNNTNHDKLLIIEIINYKYLYVDKKNHIKLPTTTGLLRRKSA